MILPDVNILVYAHRRDAKEHRMFRRWLEEVIEAGCEWVTTDRGFRALRGPALASPFALTARHEALDRRRQMAD